VPPENISVRHPWFVIPHGMAVQLTQYPLPSEVAAELEEDSKKQYALAAVALLPVPAGKGMNGVYLSAAGEGLARGTFILSGLRKSEAHELAQKLGYTPAQVTRLMSAVKRATATSLVRVTRDGPNVLVQIFRAGRDGGFQVMRSEVGMNGAVKTVQIAYDSLGRLVHYDPKGVRVVSGEELVRAVVHGESDWTQLLNDGWTIEARPGGFLFGGNFLKPVPASVRDVARGLICVSKLGHPAQHRWANFLLHASSIIDLELEEPGELGERLLEQLWDLAAGKEISAEVLEAARRRLETDA
jgi:hypothetical protein